MPLTSEGAAQDVEVSAECLDSLTRVLVAQQPSGRTSMEDSDLISGLAGPIIGDDSW